MLSAAELVALLPRLSATVVADEAGLARVANRRTLTPRIAELLRRNFSSLATDALSAAQLAELRELRAAVLARPLRRDGAMPPGEASNEPLPLPLETWGDYEAAGRALERTVRRGWLPPFPPLSPPPAPVANRRRIPPCCRLIGGEARRSAAPRRPATSHPPRRLAAAPARH